MLHSFFQV